jgi:predicted transcriptional regulator
MPEVELQTRNNLYGFDYLEPDSRRRDDQYDLDENGESKPLVYEIKQLWQRSHEIVNLSAIGYKNKEIAEILNISPVTVSNTLNGKLGQHKLSEIRQDRDIEAKKTVEKIRVLTNKALNVYHEIFDNESGESTARDRKAVADTVILELSGLRAPTKVQSLSVHTTLTRDEIESFKERGIKAAQVHNPVIDVESEDVSEESAD